MEILMIILFLLGYTCIAMEHSINVNKAASALLLCALLWTVYILNVNPEILGLSPATPHEDLIRHVTGVQIIEHLGDVASTLFFLMGAMTIVELIDVHGGFSIITNKITTRKKKELLWLIAFITFFMSAILDNLTTTIVMVMLLRKLVSDQKERWIFACIVIMAANAGGAFSPIGDVTTIMLWVRGNVTTAGLIPNLFIPAVLSIVVPTLIASRFLKGELAPISVSNQSNANATANFITPKEQKIIFYMGIGALIFVPVFKSITHLPPFIGVLLGLSILWIYTELMYHKKSQIPESSKARITNVLSRIDLTTILFFLGILMAVAALQCAGILHDLSIFLEEHIGNVFVIDIVIGILSSIIDNVPLVAGSMGMYPLATAAQVAADPSLAVFAQDGIFWMFLAYCAGVGGSILIIGSAAGVVVMGLEKVSFGWYLKRISGLALIGYLAGALFFVVQELYIRPLL